MDGAQELPRRAATVVEGRRHVASIKTKARPKRTDKVAPRDRPRYCRSMRRMWAWLKTQLRWIWGASEMSVLFSDYPENSDRERR